MVLAICAVSAMAAVPVGKGAGDLLPIPEGTYVPLLPGKQGPARIPVATFLLDSHAVTNAEYLAFVQANPNWRRSTVSPLFADEHYLAAWQSDLEPGGRAPLGAPVVNVSWFGARAYAKWKGLRLPTTAEWELAARASLAKPDGTSDPAMLKRLLDWLAAPTPDLLPDAASGEADLHGIHNLHGLVWEWVVDFNTAMVTGESRADSGLERDLFCGAGALGARNMSDYPGFMRLAFRSSLRANYCVANLGFRCAKSLPLDSK
jgi:formylglycine-generating enzyme required for sulfatase activity